MDNKPKIKKRHIKSKKDHYYDVDLTPDSAGYSGEIKHNIRRVFWLYFTLFMVLTVYIFKLIVFDSKEIIANPYNPRLKLQEDVKRGDILDKKGEILATTVYNSTGAALNTYTREYPYGKDFAHLVGYSSYGKAGVEAKYNFQLETINMEVVQRINNLTTGKPLQGDSVVLTVDSGLQSLVHKQLGKHRGAVVVLEPSTGKILAMASYPDFDPNNIKKEWEKLRTDEENSPLLNRATQGLYPPGSIFKVVTSAASYENMSDYDIFSYECKGEEYFGNNRIRCFNSKAHGHITMEQAFPKSCNTFYSTIGMKLGGEILKINAEKAYFNKPYPFPLEYSKSSFKLDENSGTSEIIETAIGQGKTLATPTHMAMLASALANGGLMMEPYVVDHTVTNTGSVKNKNLPKPLEQVFSFEEADYIKNLMIATVQTGTGHPASVSSVTVAGKTGTAENSSGDDHGWFISFAPAENPKVAIAVITENSGGAKKPMEITKNIVEYVMNNDI